MLLKALGLDRATHPESVAAAEITGDRREVLAALTRAGVSVRGAAELPGVWQMRRLVGLAPPGILEELGVGWGASHAALLAALESVPPSRRVEAYVEASLADWAVLDAAALARLRPDAPAALAYARETLPLLSPDEHSFERAALFTAFSASGGTVPEGADERLPLGPRELLVEHLEAIAPARRDVVLTALLEGQRTSANVEAATLLLETFPDLPRARTALRRLLDHLLKQRLTPYEKKALVSFERRLRTVEKSGHPAPVAAATGTLTVTARNAPRRATELGPLVARQLVETGRRFDGKKLPAARRLSLDENDEAAIGAILEHLTISDGARPVFEAWLHGDAGVFFAAGTCDVVAERGGGVTMLEQPNDDDALLRALDAIGPSKAAIRSVAEVRSATVKKAGASPRKKRARGPRRVDR